MAIFYHCSCGQNIRLPNGAAGKKARCKVCHLVFVVPGDVPVIRRPPPSSAPPTEAETEEEQREQEDESRENHMPQEESESIYSLPGRMEFHDEISGPQSPFWADLLGSFTFFVEPGNLITLLVITAAQFGLDALGYLPFIWFLHFAAYVLLAGFLCAFYFAIIRETASGEDDLPTVWFTRILDDLIVPLLEFLCTFLAAFMPALILVFLNYYYSLSIPLAVIWLVAVLGCLLWPAIILTVALGGGVGSLMPHHVVLTPLAAPLAYLAICATILVAMGILIVPELPQVRHYVAQAGLVGGLFTSALNVYAFVVAMRAIGLYYRHFKHKFPWTAE
ncbi:MAG TPA: hypothetical protein PKY77_20185 [Phycisphaerae bacterium]|nr:hypothetical protein [Phycisphaerae bacterium]HRY71066.1 hypothetical protein [Phycisphaerae bacterium]HSA29156.1 hypothetical protein [Phycisphaerae bacterium]